MVGTWVPGPPGLSCTYIDKDAPFGAGVSRGVMGWGRGELEGRKVDVEGRSGAPSPCFLQEYDLIGVKEWGYAKNMILWELGEKQLKVESWKVRRLRKEDNEGELNAETHKRAQRSEEEGTGTDSEGKAERAIRGSG